MSNNDTPTPSIKRQLPYRLRRDSWWLVDDDGTERENTARHSAFNMIVGGVKEKPIDRDSLHSKPSKIAVVRQV
jgi:hypothetical protein